MGKHIPKTTSKKRNLEWLESFAVVDSQLVRIYSVKVDHRTNRVFVLKDNTIAVEPRYNDPRYNDISGITINMVCPGKSYSKMYGTEPRYNNLRDNDIPDTAMSF